MTREEAINILEDWYGYFVGRSSDKVNDALNMAIKAIDQESILDKIRVEIEGYKSTIDRAISEDELKIEGMKQGYVDCLKIIDKYKSEVTVIKDESK